jgi:divalent metal cation (Fe/Co/Zn/Cd) transporter
MKRVDVVALIAGLLLTGVAACALWYSVTATMDWQLLKVVAPAVLVVVGVLGLALSRNRS